MLPLDEVVRTAKAAKDKGATRFCMGAAWRGGKARDFEPVLAMVRDVKDLGLEPAARSACSRTSRPSSFGKPASTPTTTISTPRGVLRR